MTRKRRQRNRTNPVAVSAAKAHAPAAEPKARPWLGRVLARITTSVGRYSGSVLYVVGMVSLVVLLAALVVIRLRSAPGAWPTRHEIGLSWSWIGAGALALVWSSVFVWGAQSALSRDRRRMTQLCLAAALLLMGSFLFLRGWEWRGYYVDGIEPWNLQASVFDEADVYYVHAVKERLRELARDLESRRARQAGAFTAAEERRLELVSTLQTSLVGWTEQEVGHWLDDAQLKRDLMEVMAFEIRPTPARRDAARRRVETEQGDLVRRRAWFAAVREYCRQQPAADARPAAELAATLQRLGARQWAYAQAVVRDAGDATLIGERLTQIAAALGSIDARTQFVRAYVEPLWATPAAPGHNRRFPGLRLPVCFPQARAWVTGYALITSVHGALALWGTISLGGVLIRMRAGTPAPRLRPLAWRWHAVVALGGVAAAALYCC